MIKLKQFFLALSVFVVGDILWLGIIIKDFNMRQLAEIGRIENGAFQMQYVGATFAYIFMALAVVFYTVPLVTKQDSQRKIFLNGALMGLIIYGVFDMTNWAILKNYPLPFILPDMAWGTFIFGIVTMITARAFKDKK